MKRDIIKLRSFCLRKYNQGWSGNLIAEHLQIPRQTVYYWLNKYTDSKELYNKKTGPKDPHKTDEKTAKFVIKLREKFNWGPNKIEGWLREHKPRGVELIGHNTIYRILVQTGLNNLLDFVRKTWGTKRFEREHSNSLWQGDFKLNEKDEWMLSFIDDHSRFAVASAVIEPTAEEAIKLFERAVEIWLS